MNEFQEKWQKVLQLLEADLEKVSFDTWFRPLKFKNVDTTTKTLYILCEKEFAISIIKGRYMHLLQGYTETIFNEAYSIELVLGSDEPIIVEEKPAEISTTSTVNMDFLQETIINPRYTFDNFVVGSNNEYAHAASLAVAEHPASDFNPLYLFGDSGLGKTHLMHAICNYIFQNHPGKKVLYVTSEMFTNEIISAIRHKRQPQFRDKYRAVDVLLIDDVQFFQGKQGISEEVFNTFNALYDSNKQIVISSDRHPSELTDLEERLRSRFGWKIVADVKKPTYETRVAILYKKAEEANLPITNNIEAVFSMIAERVKNNIRELEGAFTNLLSISRMLNKEITPEFAKETLSNLFSDEDKDINVESIKRIVARYFNITVKDIDSKTRSRDIAYPRQIAMYLTKELTDLSLPKIGKAFGGKDHTTVMHAHKKIKEELTHNESTKHAVSEIEKKIKL